MSTAKVLQARIDELSLAIERQKEALRNLEKSRSEARRQLNATLDPMAHLPVEISSEIFVRCLQDSPRPDPGEAPLLFLHVCHLWADIAIATPSLWTSIRWEPMANTVNLDIWLRRARNLPLSIALHGALLHDAAVAVQQHAHHLQSLTLESPQLESNQNLMVTPFPCLTDLTLLGVGITRRVWDGQGMNILRNAPILKECHFISLRWGKDGRQPIVPLTHLSLRRLRLDGPQCGAFMLNYLTLPALDVLYISGWNNLTITEFTSFLTRSSAPLRFLSLAGLENDDLDELLRLLPGVTDLVLKFSEVTIDPLPMLKKSVLAPGQNLPNLRRLRIHVCFIDGGVNYEEIIGALAARHAGAQVQLESFSLFTDPGNPEPEPQITAALAQFARESGMRIRVGASYYRRV